MPESQLMAIILASDVGDDIPTVPAYDPAADGTFGTLVVVIILFWVAVALFVLRMAIALRRALARIQTASGNPSAPAGRCDPDNDPDNPFRN